MNFSRSRGLVAFKVEYGRMKGRSSPLYASVQTGLRALRDVLSAWLKSYPWSNRGSGGGRCVKGWGQIEEREIEFSDRLQGTPRNPFTVRRQKVCQSIDHLVIVLRKRLCPIRGSINNNLFRKKFQYLFKVKGEGGSPNKILQHQLVTYRPVGAWSFCFLLILFHVLL